MKKIGIYTADLVTPGGSSRKGCLMAERLSAHYDVWLISRGPVDRTLLARNYGVTLTRVHLLALDEPSGPVARVLNELLKVFPTHIRSILTQIAPYRRMRRMHFDLFILNSSTYYMRAAANKSIMMCMFPWPTPNFPRARWCHWPLIKPLIRTVLGNTLSRDPDAVASYSAITANSEFTSHWIRQRWNRESRVVYSASETMPAIAPGKRQKVILMVGRYNWDKQQEVLLDAFRGLTELHELGWELHFVGRVHPDSAPYHEQLLQNAAGIPVQFHYDASAEALGAFYAQSAMCWNAKGFGIPANEPEHLEHFGNTPLEAMANGCVPVVFDGGGMRETVQQGVNGFRWQTIAELQSVTRRLALDSELLSQISERGRTIDARFGVTPFLDSVEQVVADVIGQPPSPL
ncbi:MAG: glycosyltransferase family 4 protein [Gemmatimonadaceae bacterium]